LIVRLLTRTAVLLASATVTVGLVPAATAAPRALDAPSSRVVSAFPNDASTVPDPAQLTGRRVNLPLPDCQVRPTDCNTVRLLNQLDGFDLDPRLAVTFDRAVNPAVVAAGMRVTPVGGSSGTGVDRVVYDSAANTVYAHPRRQLTPGTTYRITVDTANQGKANQGNTNQGNGDRRDGATTFTTLSATDGLKNMVTQLDSGSAYTAAGIAAQDRGLRWTRRSPPRAPP